MVRGLLELLEAQRRTCFYGAEQVDLDAAGMIAANQRESSDRQKYDGKKRKELKVKEKRIEGGRGKCQSETAGNEAVGIYI